MKKWLMLGLLALSCVVQAQGNLEVNTPAVSSLKASMQGRFAQLEPLFAAGALGLTRDGRVEVRDPTAIPLAQRQSATSLVGAENRDRTALYREIARANGHPEWEADIANTFGGRWIDKARAGWWVQEAGGQWKQK